MTQLKVFLKCRFHILQIQDVFNEESYVKYILNLDLNHWTFISIQKIHFWFHPQYYYQVLAKCRLIEVQELKLMMINYLFNSLQVFSLNCFFIMWDYMISNL